MRQSTPSDRGERERPFRNTVIVTDVALVSIVGEGLHTNLGIAAECFSAVPQADANIEMISSGTSYAALYFMVKGTCLDYTIQALHNIFLIPDLKNYPGRFSARSSCFPHKPFYTFPSESKQKDSSHIKGSL